MQRSYSFYVSGNKYRNVLDGGVAMKALLALMFDDRAFSSLAQHPDGCFAAFQRTSRCLARVWGHLIVHFATVCDTHDQDHKLFILNTTNSAVITYSVTP